MKCPICNTNAKETGKEWKYGVFYTKQFLCSECQKKFNVYYKNGKLSHTIPKPK